MPNLTNLSNAPEKFATPQIEQIELRSYSLLETLVNLPPVSRLFLEKCSLMTRLNEYVKTAEAARILGVSQNTLRAWAESGKIPVRRNPANGYRLFLRRNLERFLIQAARTAKRMITLRPALGRNKEARLAARMATNGIAQCQGSEPEN